MNENGGTSARNMPLEESPWQVGYCVGKLRERPERKDPIEQRGDKPYLRLITRPVTDHKQGLSVRL